MNKRRIIYIWCVLVLSIGLIGWSILASAGEKKEKAVEMPLLTGELWQKMTPDAKVAFIWGIGHVLGVERNIMEEDPDLRRDSFVMKAVEGMANVPMNEIVRQVDTYYRTHPNQLDTPVMRVIWDTVIRPNVKSGTAGRPLQ